MQQCGGNHSGHLDGPTRDPEVSKQRDQGYFNTHGSAVVSACLMWFAREADRQVLGKPPIPDTSEWPITELCKERIKKMGDEEREQRTIDPG